MKWEKKAQERRPWEAIFEDQVEKRMDFRESELQVPDGRNQKGTSGPWEEEGALRGQCWDAGWNVDGVQERQQT